MAKPPPAPRPSRSTTLPELSGSGRPQRQGHHAPAADAERDRADPHTAGSRPRLRPERPHRWRLPFGFWIDADAKAPDSYAVYLYQAGLGLPDRDYYLKRDPNSQALLHKYEQHIAAMLTCFGETDAQAKAKRILALETRLARSSGTTWPCETERRTTTRGR